MRLSNLLLLFIVVISNYQGVIENNTTQLPQQNSSKLQHMEGFLYIQECPSTQTNNTSTNRTSFEIFIEAACLWLYYVYSASTLSSIEDHYIRNKFCFTFTVILIMGHIHIELIQMFSSATLMFSFFLKGVYFCSLVIANTCTFFSVLFSEKLRAKQYELLFIYFTILSITGIWDQQSYERIQA